MQPRRLSAFQIHKPSVTSSTELYPLDRGDSLVPRDPLDGSESSRHASLPTSSLELGESVKSSSSTRDTGRKQRPSSSTAPSRIYLNPPTAATGPSSPGQEPSTTRIDKEALPGVFEILQEWSSVAADRHAKKQLLEERKKKETEIRAKQTPLDAIYARLLRSVETPRFKAWQKLVTSLYKQYPSLTKIFPSAKEVDHCLRPPKQDLISLAHHCYPPRFGTKALVCDFGDDQCDLRFVEVREIEFHWTEKPDWAYVRWIHVPFGRGVSHSSIEDLFLHAHPIRRTFPNGGESVWPFLQTEILNFRSAYDFKRMRDVYLMLSEDRQENNELKEALNASTFGKTSAGHLKDDMIWRANFIGTPLNYWDLVQTDMPFDLSEGGGLSEALMTNYQYTMLGPRHGLKKLEREQDLQSNPGSKQAIARHPYFEGTQLVRNDFRAFHGDDGFLLTMSAASGVDFLDNQFRHYLNLSRETLLQNPDATVVGLTVERFESVGCKWWNRKTAEWLLVYLITEYATSPHPFTGGMVAPTLSEAYSAVVLDLNRGRYDPWQKNETISLVRDMLACVDELNVLVSVHAKKIKLFTGLIQDCRNMEAEDIQRGIMPDNAGSESALARAQNALRLTEESHHCYVRLLADLKESLSALFQLRSIEQDELAKLADKQNKAVVIFTAVTIVFLPLSFFTSYFGMNLRDLTNQEPTQAYFWELCGTIAVVIVVFVLIFAYRHHFHMSPKLWSNSR